MTREVLSNGVIVPEKYTRDWFDDFRTNLVKLNDAITAIAGKQNALTQEQLDAVNSAITSQKVTAYDDHIADTSKHLTDGTAAKAIADEDGTSIKTGYVNVAGNQTVSGNKSWTGSNTFNNILPNATNTYSLGSSSYQWASVYAQTYYYNGTAWGLDKINTWSAQQIFVGNNSRGLISMYNPAYTKGGTLSVTDLSIGSIYMGDEGRTGLANSLVFISTDIGLSGASTLLSLSALENTTSSTNRANLVVAYDKNDAENPRKVTIQGTVMPHPSVPFSLGTSTNKWKTLNGINPGALSLPDLSKQVILDIIPPTGESSVNWSEGANTFTPPANGWISIRHDNCKFIQVYQNTNNRLGVTSERSSYGKIVVSLPVLGGSLYSLFMDAQSGTVHYLFYPCLGNV